ncbi:MAG: AAA family ATPase [Desulfamplus sp.]|nr:AAA family ATPase [Desulfamplus sp.]
MKALPLGINTLDKIRENSFVYVDKTKFVYLLTRDKSILQ